MRATVATALLADLKRVEIVLRQLYKAPKAARIALPDLPLFYDSLRSEVRHFAADTVYAVNEVFERYRHALGMLHQIRSAGGTISEQNHYSISALSGFGLQAVPAAKAALIEEGGELGNIPLAVPVTFPNLPPIPEKQFADTLDVGPAAAALTSVQDGGPLTQTSAEQP